VQAYSDEDTLALQVDIRNGELVGERHVEGALEVL
jgi:hypothetical protein